MRELERDLIPTPTELEPIAIVGRGRVGSSLAAAADAAGIPVKLTASPDAAIATAGATAALLCVPDEAIGEVAAAVATADRTPALVGHVSGATTLDPLASAGSRGSLAFSLHPLQTFPGPATPVAGIPAATAGSTEAAEDFAEALALALGMRPFPVSDEQRAAYHAAASIASNFLVALEESASGLLASAGIEDGRELLTPLVLASAANWAEKGGDALTGPIARGDFATVERHLAALAETAPELIPMYEALAERTRAHAADGASA
jgi:predicted short-subunit dehydrogenase-like oxidoreductase (DUF2520 family)